MDTALTRNGGRRLRYERDEVVAGPERQGLPIRHDPDRDTVRVTSATSVRGDTVILSVRDTSVGCETVILPLRGISVMYQPRHSDMAVASHNFSQISHTNHVSQARYGILSVTSPAGDTSQCCLLTAPSGTWVLTARSGRAAAS